MSAGESTTAARRARGGEFWILAAAGALSLVPFLAYHELFSRLFWFGDEFDLIDQIDRFGFWRWVWLAFAENVVPLFKLGWGGAVFAFGGSYAAMIALVWILHALNVALLGRAMRTCGMPWLAVFFAQALFGLAPANLETLAWSVQGSAVLSITFMLLALDAVLGGRGLGGQVACVAASALSFSRGVLTGPVVALGAVCGPGDRAGRPFPARARAAAALVAPSLVVGALIALLATGNHRHMEGHGAEALVFGTWYYLANPVHTLLAVESVGWHTVLLLGALKLLLVAWALARSAGRAQLLFLMLVAFELGNAVLLGIGRYHTGLGGTLASRYQYASLVGIAPMAGLLFARLAARVPGPRQAGRACAALALIALGLGLVSQWAGVLGPFSAWRGTDSRRILLVDPSPGPGSVPGIPAMGVGRARELIAKYRLH